MMAHFVAHLVEHLEAFGNLEMKDYWMFEGLNAHKALQTEANLSGNICDNEYRWAGKCH